MNKRKTILRLIFLCVSLTISSKSFAQLPFIEKIEISKEDYIANFEQIHSIVKKKYSHTRDKHLDLKSLSENLKKRILSVNTKQDYFKQLLYYFSELKNSHTTIYLREYGISCTAELIEGRLFIENVNDKQFADLGVQPKDEILTIDDLPVKEWLKNESEYISASTPAHDINNAIWKVFNSNFKTKRVFKIRTREGIKSIAVTYNKATDYSLIFSPNKPKVTYKKLNDSTGYIEITSMTGKVVSEFMTAYNKLNHLPNLIVDIRKNTGGNSGFSELITQFLINKKQRACVSRKKIKPHSNSYKGNLYLLIGVRTASAAESFAIDLWESGRVVLVGSPTAGDTGNRPQNFSTDYGISFRIPAIKKPQKSFKNFPMEGVGIPPNYKITQTVNDYLNDVDTEIEFVIKMISK